jgi:hypothetical protein
VKWYSVKKYIPPVKEYIYFVRLSNGEIYTATIESYEHDGRHSWISEDDKYFDDYSITHFCIPDPIEIEND